MNTSDIACLTLFISVIVLWLILKPKFIYNELESKLFLFYGPKDKRKLIDLTHIL